MFPEAKAKDFLSRIIIEGSAKPCDIDGAFAVNLPVWYDNVAFKRGQQYIRDNRFGILNSNMYGLLTLLAEPRGLQILASTGRTSDADRARIRYVSTLMHVQRWYEMDLSPGSATWASMHRVRRMHVAASIAAQRNGYGKITQTELGLTLFGFMGFALIRPHLLGIRHDCNADRIAFVHFWAVMAHTLGVHEVHNMCLLPLPVVELVCKLLLRDLFVPLIQLESPLFKSMASAMIVGMQSLMPLMTYDVQMFCVRRLCGVPGYQYCVDGGQETLCPVMFTEAEACQMRLEFSQNACGGTWTVGAGVELIAAQHAGDSATVGKDAHLHNDNTALERATLEQLHRPLMSAYRAQCERLTDRMAYPESGLSDEKFYQLSAQDQAKIRWQIRILSWYEFRVVRFGIEALMDIFLYCMSKLYGCRIDRKQ